MYLNPKGNIKFDVRLKEETVCLTQEQMSTLFGKGRITVAEHNINVYEDGELEQFEPVGNSDKFDWKAVEK